MSIFKKTRLDRSVIVENKTIEAVKELEASYPRIEEEAEPSKRVSNTSTFQHEAEPVVKTRVNKTINPYIQAQTRSSKSVIKLTPITKENEQSLATLIVEDASTIVNRSNIDPENPTISTKSHALLEIRDGQVFLNNQTAAETTFIQVKQPTQLQNGDVILLGNRLIRVNIENSNVTTNGLDD